MTQILQSTHGPVVILKEVWWSRFLGYTGLGWHLHCSDVTMITYTSRVSMPGLQMSSEYTRRPILNQTQSPLPTRSRASSLRKKTRHASPTLIYRPCPNFNQNGPSLTYRRASILACMPCLVLFIKYVIFFNVSSACVQTNSVQGEVYSHFDKL